MQVCTYLLCSYLLSYKRTTKPQTFMNCKSLDFYPGIPQFPNLCIKKTNNAMEDDALWITGRFRGTYIDGRLPLLLGEEQRTEEWCVFWIKDRCSAERLNKDEERSTHTVLSELSPNLQGWWLNVWRADRVHTFSHYIPCFMQDVHTYIAHVYLIRRSSRYR